MTPADRPSAPLRIGLVDRSLKLEELLVAAAERAEVPADLGVTDPPSSLSGASEREDVLVLGPKELTPAGLRRLTRYLESHPLTVVVAVGGDPAGGDRETLRAAGVSLVVKGEATVGKLTAALRKAAAAVAARRADASDASDGELQDTGKGRDGPADEPSREDGDSRDGAADGGDDRLFGDEDELEEALDDGLFLEDDPGAGYASDPAALATPPHDLGPGHGENTDDLVARLGLHDDERQETPTSTPTPVASGNERAVVLTVASATGGCGKTFFATNLAALVARGGHRALLVDLDLQFGEVAAALRVSHPYSVYDGLYDPQGRPLPDEDLGDHLDALVHHHILGFDVLTAPRDPALADYVGARDAAHVLDTVSTRYDVVIVDTPPSLNEVVLTALDRSDVVSVLATLDVPALKNLTVFLDTLRRLKIDDSCLRLVMNKVEPDVGIDVKQAQSVFANRFVGQIPQSRAVSRSINAGSVVVSTEPRTAVSRMVTAAVAATLPPGLVAPVDTRANGEQGAWKKFLGLFRRGKTQRAHSGGVE